MTTTSPAATDTDVQAKRDTIYADGIVGVPGAFSTEWADRLREDIGAAYAEACGFAGGPVTRPASSPVVPGMPMPSRATSPVPAWLT